MKKILCWMIAIVAVCMLAVVCTAEETAAVPTACAAGCENPQWVPASSVENISALPAGHHHIYLDGDITPKQMIIRCDETAAPVTLCLDLNGHGITTDGRTMIVHGDCTVNIMDSSAEQDGYICGTQGDNNQKGGTIAVNEEGTLNLYSGSLRFEWDEVGKVMLTSAGVVWVQNGGTMNMYGGQVEGADMMLDEEFETGAAIYVDGRKYTDEVTGEETILRGQLNVYGGRITSGTLPETGKADCVYMETYALMTLSGDAHVDDIFLYDDALTVDGTFSGEAWLNLRGGNLVDGAVVGSAINDPAVTGQLFCISGDGWHVRVSGDDLVLEAWTPITEERYCRHCGQDVIWKGITKSNFGHMKTKEGPHHFFLTENFTAGQIQVRNADACIDLNGYNIDVLGRALYVNTGCTLSLMDSVGTGKVISTTGINNCGGGVVHVSGATFNLYSGTMELVYQYVPGRGVGTGGIIYAGSDSVVNVYGGTINGGQMELSEYPSLFYNGCGAAVYVGGSAVLNVSGGEINSGTLGEGCRGECVFVGSNKGKVNLSGSGKVEDIYFVYERDCLTVTGEYTGSANLTYPEETPLNYRQVLGKSQNASFAADALTCDEYVLTIDGSNLILDYNATAAIFNSTGMLLSDTLAEAVELCTDGYIMMLRSVEEDVTADQDIYLDLNGFTVAGTVTLAQGKTLYGMDNLTDDFTVADGKYGKLTATVTGSLEGLPEESVHSPYAYLPVTEEGGVSFHAVNLNLTAMTLRPNVVGVYYKCAFAADEVVAPLVESYGVALSIRGVPTAENLESACEYSTFTDFTAGGMDTDVTSTLLKEIMKPTSAPLVNNRNANMPVYGRAYLRTSSGIVFGGAEARTLRQQAEASDTYWSTLSETQKTAFFDMYRQYYNVMRYWNLPNLAQEQDGILKVLILGNSHSLDATNLLYEVFHTEAPEQKLVLGALYYSGCSISQHSDFLTNNQKVYTYHKNDGSQPNRTWVVRDSTCLEALQDEQWDIIFMQVAPRRSSIDATYDSDWKVVADYLLNNQDIPPKLALHYSWASPDDYELYLNDDAPYNHPTTPTSWRTTYEKYYSVDGKYNQRYAYQVGTAEALQYLINSTDVVGRAFDLVVPSCTAIQYAHDILGRDHEELYRDYTHMNDYGRLMVAYGWYAKIMGLDQITEVKLDEIPSVLHHSKSLFPEANADGNFSITADMKADIITSVNWMLQNPWNLPETD